MGDPQEHKRQQCGAVGGMAWPGGPVWEGSRAWGFGVPTRESGQPALVLALWLGLAGAQRFIRKAGMLRGPIPWGACEEGMNGNLEQGLTGDNTLPDAGYYLYIMDKASFAFVRKIFLLPLPSLLGKFFDNPLRGESCSLVGCYFGLNELIQVGTRHE